MEPVIVYEAANLLEAEIVKGRLEAEGIPALIRGEALGTIFGLTAGELAKADVLVPAALAERAAEILAVDVVEPETDDAESDETVRAAEDFMDGGIDTAPADEMDSTLGGSNA